MAFIQDKTAAVIGGAALTGIAVKNVLPVGDQTFRLPGISTPDLLNFWIPLIGAAALLFPDILKGLGLASGMVKTVGAGIAIGIGAREISQGRLFGGLEDAIRGPVTTATGVVLIAA